MSKATKCVVRPSGKDKTIEIENTLAIARDWNEGLIQSGMRDIWGLMKLFK